MKRTIDYRVVVEGAEEKGHPIVRVTKSHKDASVMMDLLHAAYPDKEIVMYMSSEEELSRIVPGATSLPPPSRWT